jgi:hypothetical protein
MSVRKSWTDDRRLMLIEFTNPLNESELSFPVLECFHILGFIMLVGTTAVVDFRLLGVGMRRQTVADLAKNLAPWTLIGLVLVLLSGPLLFSSDPDMYYLNRAFQIKMVCLVLAILFNYTIHRKATVTAATPGGGKLIACTSLALWFSVIAGGMFIGFA